MWRYKIFDCDMELIEDDGVYEDCYVKDPRDLAITICNDFAEEHDDDCDDLEDIEVFNIVYYCDGQDNWQMISVSPHFEVEKKYTCNPTF